MAVTNRWSSTDFGVPPLPFHLPAPAARRTKAHCVCSTVLLGMAAREFLNHMFIAKFTSCLRAVLTMLTALAVHISLRSHAAFTRERERVKSRAGPYAQLQVQMNPCRHCSSLFVQGSVSSAHQHTRIPLLAQARAHIYTHEYPSEKITVTSSYNFT